MPRNTRSQIGVTLYNVRDFSDTPKEIAKTLRRIGRIGYTNIQVSGGGFGKIEPAELRKIAADAGLSIIGSHIDLESFREDIGAVMDRMKGWGCRYAAIPYLGAEYWQAPGGWKRVAKEFTKHGKVLAGEGLVLQYHNHHFEFQHFGGRGGIGGRTGLEILYAESDPKYLQAELDVGWVAHGGGDPAAWTRSLTGRIDQVHVKDWRMLNSKPIWAEIGEGNLNWRPILAACKAARVKHYIVEQDDCPVTKNPFRSIEISYNNLRKLGVK